MANQNFFYLIARRENNKWANHRQNGSVWEVPTEAEAGYDRLINNYGINRDGSSNVICFKYFTDTNRFRITDEVNIGDFTLPMVAGESLINPQPVTLTLNSQPQMTEAEVMNLLQTATDLRPKNLILSDVKWKYLVRSVLRGKNLMITGPSGNGKTLAVTTVAAAMERPFFYFNLGATQDPRSTLIGNTHFDKNSGTYFADSTFIKAIQTENAVILLDELSRAHPEAWNILMTVLDENQRYVRVDESPTAPVVKVAPGVAFLATANIGMEYTSTRVIDRAILDRFQLLEMDILTKEQQRELVMMTCPSMDEETARILADIYNTTQTEAMDGSKIQTAISTRTLLAAAGLICDGFTIQEAADVCIYPYYSNDGGIDSERTYVKQIVQKFIPDANLKSDNMFDENDTVKS